MSYESRIYFGEFSLNVSGLKKYFFNTLWLFFNHGIRLLLGFFVGLWLARYLGPEKFGLYQYCASYALVYLTLSRFGLDEILLKRLIQSKNSYENDLNSAFWLRLILGSFLYLILCLTLYLTEESDITIYYIMIASFCLFVQPFEVVDVANRALVRMKLSTISKIIQLFVSALIKIILIIYKADLIWFVVVLAIDAISYNVVNYLSYICNTPPFVRFSINWRNVYDLLIKSLPLAIVSICSIVFLRVDHLLVNHFLGNAELGFYSAASKMLELLGMFPALILTSLFTALLNAKSKSEFEYNQRLKRLGIFLFCTSVTISIISYLFSSEIIQILYGSSYTDSADVFSILSFNLIFLSANQLIMRWYIAENLIKQLVFKNVLMMCSGVGVYLLVIPRWGIIGVSYASVGLHFMFYFLYDLIFYGLHSAKR